MARARLRLVTALLGLENCSAVTLHDLVSNRFRAAELYGRLANIAGDLDGGWLTSTAMFKMVTGGDTIGAERKFGQPFSFTPAARLCSRRTRSLERRTPAPGT